MSQPLRKRQSRRHACGGLVPPLGGRLINQPGHTMIYRILVICFLLSSIGCSSQSITLRRTSEDVCIQRDKISLTGTIEIPSGQDQVPAILMVQGSAAFDRSNYGLFDILADRLADSGIASLRIDDRGVGGSGGVKHDLSAAELAEDIIAVLDYLASRPETNPEMIGLFGHSFGGALIPLVASKSNDAAFVITLAGYAVSGEALMQNGRRLSEESQGKSPGELYRILSFQQSMFNAARNDGPWEEVETEHHALRMIEFDRMSEEARASYNGFDSYLQQTYDEAVLQLAKTPWFKSFLALDPGVAIQGLDIPFLAIFGELDSSVPPSQNVGPMTTALSENPDGTVVVIPGVGHFFRESGNTSQELLSIVVEWILEEIED